MPVCAWIGSWQRWIAVAVVASTFIYLVYIARFSVSVGPKQSEVELDVEDIFHISQDGRFQAYSMVLQDAAHRVRIIWSASKAPGRPLRWEEIIELWQTDTKFVDFYADLLAQAPFETFFWECPGVDERSVADKAEYEHVTLHNYWGFANASSSAFDNHLRSCRGKDEVVTFKNLGGDAMLVAPCESASVRAEQVYGHLAQFSRNAPRSQMQAFWATLGRMLKNRLAERHDLGKTWVSTEGSGVPWLHLRMDSEPKYYHHQEYTV